MEKEKLAEKAKEMKAKIDNYYKIALECKDFVKLIVKELGGGEIIFSDDVCELPCFTSYSFNEPTEMLIKRICIGENDKLFADCYAIDLDDDYELDIEQDNLDAFLSLAENLLNEFTE